MEFLAIPHENARHEWLIMLIQNLDRGGKCNSKHSPRRVWGFQERTHCFLSAALFLPNVRKSVSYPTCPLPSSGLPWWLRWQRICLQCRKLGFHPWVKKIRWGRAWQPTPVFLSGTIPRTQKPGGLQSTGSQRVGHDSITNIYTQLWESLRRDRCVMNRILLADRDI